MLTTLHIRNFVLVESLELDFHSGFTALTGETGAGKSILIDALQLLFGARADIDFIRQGCDKSELIASFTVSDDVRQWLASNDVDNGEDELLLRRTLESTGKSKAWINGYPATQSQLKDLSSRLVVVHGQHAHQSLLRKGAQLEMLDSYAKLVPAVREVESAYKEWKKLKETYEKAMRESSLNQEKIKRLEWMLSDLKELKPAKGEWQKINEEHSKLSRFTEILEACGRVREILSEDDNSALSLIDSAISDLESISDADKRLEGLYNELNDAREIVSTVSDDAESYLSRMDFDEEAFAELDQRISLYLNLSAKYRVEPEELHDTYVATHKQLAELREIGTLPKLEEKVKATKQKYDGLASELSKARRKGAQTMQRQITKAMQTLALAGGSFSLELTALDAPGSRGNDHCEFLVAGHAGANLRPLSKVASGGELARISLAVAVTDTSTATVDTLIFDEVDSGIGGGVAETVGHLLARIGENQQVLCVTHLPQVASCADHQMKIVKHAEEGQTPYSSVLPLSAEDRVEEIARMLGGLKLTEKTIEHAREMLKQQLLRRSRPQGE